VNRIFLLSPANASGIRAKMLMNPAATFELAVRFREEGASIDEVFAFMSGLYFRGKSAYAKAFAAPPAAFPGSFVITAGRGLVPLGTPIMLDDLRAIAEIPIDLADARYRKPLEQDAVRLHSTLGPECEIVLLGSIATAKYLEPLLEIFGSRLLYPSDFVGRGDMSRGGLMLRCILDQTELQYVSASSPVRRGKRPPKLKRL
jgi:hypothetical protein